MIVSENLQHSYEQMIDVKEMTGLKNLGIYLTDTKPFMHNSWLWLYDETVFKEELSQSLQETGICPVVIMQKRSTLHNNWPDNYHEGLKFDPESISQMQLFLKNFRYARVWVNDFFEMYVPAVKNPPLAQLNSQ